MPGSFVPGFRPSTSGLHFANDFPQVPVLRIRVLTLGEVPIGDASGGLCGGMVFTARDFYEARLPPPPDADPPADGTALFRHLAGRLVDSFNLPLGVLKYYEWMNLPDGDHGLVKGLARHMMQDEWPAVRRDLDAGHPCPLGLVTVRSLNPGDLAQNHQVLAFGYDLDEAAGRLALHVYDPNYPGRDDITLALSLGDPARPATIRYSTGDAVRGFFRTRYHPADVSHLASASAPGSPGAGG